MTSLASAKKILYIAPAGIQIPTPNFLAEVHLTKYEVVAANAEQDVQANLPGADAVLVQGMPLDAREIGRMASCSLIVHAGAGPGGIDLEAARSAGIFVAGVPDYASDEFVVLIEGILRQFIELRRPDKKSSRMPKLGIVGLGAIGKALSGAAITLGFDIWAHDSFVAEERFRFHRVHRCSLDDLLGSCDVVTLHRPVDLGAKSVIDARAIRLMKPSAWLINTSDPRLVDWGEAMKGLHSGKLEKVVIGTLDAANLQASDAQLQAFVSGGKVQFADVDFLADAAVRERALRLGMGITANAFAGRLPDHLLIDPALPRLLISEH